MFLKFYKQPANVGHLSQHGFGIFQGLIPIGQQHGEFLLIEFIHSAFNVFAQDKGDKLLLLVIQQGKYGRFGSFCPAVIWYSRRTLKPSTTPHPQAFSLGSINSARVSASFINCFSFLSSATLATRETMLHVSLMSHDTTLSFFLSFVQSSLSHSFSQSPFFNKSNF